MVMRALSVVAATALIFLAGTAEVSAQRPGGGHGGRPSFERLVEAFDADDSESLSEDEVPGRVWWRLSSADANGDGVVTREEFDGFTPGLSAQGPDERRGGRPSFDRLIEAFDADDSESLSEGEVPGRVWRRLSSADADGDGVVTREEFDGYTP